MSKAVLGIASTYVQAETIVETLLTEGFANADISLFANREELFGTLVRMEIPEYEAKRHKDTLRDGNILIAVYLENSAETERVERILARSNAHDISSLSATSVKRSTDLLPHPGLA